MWLPVAILTAPVEVRREGAIDDSRSKGGQRELLRGTGYRVPRLRDRRRVSSDL